MPRHPCLLPLHCAGTAGEFVWDANISLMHVGASTLYGVVKAAQKEFEASAVRVNEVRFGTMIGRHGQPHANGGPALSNRRWVLNHAACAPALHTQTRRACDAACEPTHQALVPPPRCRAGNCVLSVLLDETKDGSCARVLQGDLEAAPEE
jgi:hypothetical protein